MAGLAATAVIGTVLVPATGLVGAGAMIFTIAGGVVVGIAEDKARERLLK